MALASENVLTKLATVPAIDATLATSYTLLNVPVGKVFVPVNIVIRTTSFTSGGKSIQAIADIGGNSPSFDDYISARTFTVAAQDTAIVTRAADDTAYNVQASASVFTLLITTASNATTEVWTVDVFGYLL